MLDQKSQACIDALGYATEALSRTDLVDISDEELHEVSSFRKIVDVFMLACQKESIIPKFEFCADTSLAADSKYLCYYVEEDPLLSETILKTYSYYGWKFAPELQYDDRHVNPNDLPKWFYKRIRPTVAAFSDGYNDCAEDDDSIFGYIKIWTLHNEKISRTLSYGRSPRISEEAKTRIDELSSLVNRMTGEMLSTYAFIGASDTIWYKRFCYFISITFITCNEYGNPNYDTNMDIYLNPSCVFMLKEIDEVANQIIKDYHLNRKRRSAE